MKTSLTYTINNIDDTIIEPVAIKLGYNDTIKSLVEETFTCLIEGNDVSNPFELLRVNGISGIIKGVINDGVNVFVTYDKEVDIPNPETVLEFLQKHFIDNYVKAILQPKVVDVLTQLQQSELRLKEEELATAKKLTEEQVLSTIKVNLV